MPDVISVGVLVKPVARAEPHLRLAAESRYSQLISDMGPRLHGRRASTVDDDVLDDGNEFRAAGEYLFTNFPRRRCPPSRSAAACGTTPITASATKASFQRRQACSFQPGDSEMHYTFGGGIVFEKFQLDVGFDQNPRRAEDVLGVGGAALPAARGETPAVAPRREPALSAGF